MKLNSRKTQVIFCFLSFLFLAGCQNFKGNNPCDPRSNSYSESFLLKLSQGGVFDFCGLSVDSDNLGIASWARTVTRAEKPSRISFLANDMVGNIYGVGTIEGNSEFSFGNQVNATGSFSTGTNLYIIKYDSFGNAIWSKTVASGTNNSLFNSVAVDPSGNVYAAGTISQTGSYNFGNGITANGGGAENFLLVKYNANGDVIWAKSIVSTTNSTNFSTVAVDSLGNVYAAGFLTGSGTYSFGNGVSETITHSGDTGFLIKYDSSGNTIWVKAVLGSSTDSAFNSVVLDSTGNLVVAGRITGLSNFDFGSGITITGKSTFQNLLIAKYTTSGQTVWAKTVESATNRTVFTALTADRLGNTYAGGLTIGSGLVSLGDGVSVNGTFSLNNFLLVKYDSYGITKWARSTIEGPENSIVLGLTSDLRSNVYAAGNIVGTGKYSFGNGISLNGNASDSNYLLMRFNSDGVPKWARSVVSGNQLTRYFAASTDGFGNLYAGGTIYGNEVFTFGNRVSAQGAYSAGINQVLVQYR
ncbi:autotransporter outer membrane beta-barrel domain-containing protein [Leptospira kanakyensis]|uniref:hypothetical protein n=1 Tax=Leptospira kanakyensis TaxID=2484968 RepID=UPI00223D149E|nr:hypothetical protein [Leptospira kanakyensis]MCW7469578.1 hypothetical protein [Leptospira kanakyensis]